MENPNNITYPKLMIEFAKNMNDVYDTFTIEYFFDKVKDVKLSYRLKLHFLNKMLDLDMIKESKGLLLNGERTYYIPYAVSDLLKEVL